MCGNQPEQTPAPKPAMVVAPEKTAAGAAAAEATRPAKVKETVSKPARPSAPTDLRSHFSSMAVGAAYGVLGTAVNLSATTVMTIVDSKLGLATFLGGMACNLYAASRTKVPVAGVLSAIFGGLAVTGAVVLSGAMALSGVVGQISNQGSRPSSRPQYNEVNVTPVPALPSAPQV